MNRRWLRRGVAAAALLAFCTLVCSCAFADGEPSGLQELDAVRLTVPQSENNTSRLSGPDAQSDGTVLLEKGKPASFTWEGEYPISMWDTYGLSVTPEIYWSNTTFSLPYILRVDGDIMSYGLPSMDAVCTFRAEFQDIQLEQATIEQPQGNYPDPMIRVSGRVVMEARFTVDYVLDSPTLVLPAGEDSTAQYDQIDQYVQDVYNQLWAMDGQAGQPQEVVYRIEVNGRLGTMRGEDHSYFSFLTQDTGNVQCSVEYGGQTYLLGEQNGYSIVLDPQFGFATVNTGTQGNMTARVAATTAGAGALGLGGSAVANALSQPDALPARKKEQDGVDPDGTDAEETPQLPEQDSANVSLSLYKPFGDLINTKGAAVDIQLMISGGEGLHWNYIPTVVCPGAMRAVLPTVVGNSSKSMLVLALTGAAMRQAHCPVFITVIAWAQGPDGILKTTGTMELTLHRGGLEAVRNNDGTLTVTSYTDGNLDGLADKRVLRPDEYTLTAGEDGTVTVQAKESKLGSCTIAADEKQ